MEYINDLFSSISGSLGGALGESFTGIIGALLTLVIGLIVAKFIKRTVKKLLLPVDSKVSKGIKVSEIVSKIVYYLIMVFILILVLDMLGFGDALSPLKNMWNEFVSIIPNIIGSGIIGYAGFMLASILSDSVGMLASNIEKWLESKGIKDSVNVAGILKQVVFIFVFIPILIVALEALNMTVISDPASEMLGTLMSSIPKIIAAVVIIGVFFIVGKLVTSLLKDFLSNIGLDSYAEKIGIQKFIGKDTSLSKVVTGLVFFFIMFAGIISGLEKIELFQLTELLKNLMQLSGQIIFGLVIMLFGNFIASLAVNAMSVSNKGMASVIRVAILGLFLAMSLRTMGIANQIVDLAFGLTLGAVAIAVALSFGLGGREAAGQQMKKIFDKFNEK